MTDTALEVSLNGTVLCTVGMESWSRLGAMIQGIRISEEMLDEIRVRMAESEADAPLPVEEWLMLDCHVGLPNPDRPSNSRTHSYGSEKLAVGDEITIRIIETDRPDDPQKPSTTDDAAILIARPSVNFKR